MASPLPADLHNRFDNQPNSTCACEANSQHHAGNGIGVVANEEFLLLATFEKSPPENGRLSVKHFRSGQLSRAEVSLARQSYLSKDEFVLEVVDRLRPKFGECQGVAKAQAKTLRDITLKLTDKRDTLQRAICVSDKVQVDDYAAHAAAGHSEWVKEVKGQNSRTAANAALAEDLVDAFGDIQDLDAAYR
jgi:hypothetical protein